MSTPDDGGPNESGGEEGFPGGAFGGASGDGGAGAGGGGCFVAGTLVHTARGAVAIEHVEVGDRVLTFDFERGVPSVSSVLAVNTAKRDVLLRIDFGSEVVECTPHHRFYRDGWVEARELAPGDEVVCQDGQQRTIRSISRRRAKATVYNLTVLHDRNYSVGRLGAVAHNDKVEGGGDFDTNPDSPF
jgi:hypothetical protein